jgi:nucleotide-binding universal stress UspA family protein
VTIVVGVDGSAPSKQALAWALTEGRLRDEPVSVVYAWMRAPGTAAGRTAFGSPGTSEPSFAVGQEDAERRLAALIGEPGTSGVVEQRAVHGSPLEVLVEQSRDATLLVLGSRGRGKLAGALLGSVSRGCAYHAECPVVVIRDPSGSAAHAEPWDVDEAITRETAENAVTWEALIHLGVHDGAELRLEFVYESAGPVSDRMLAEHLHREHRYEIDIAAEGITGWTPPMRISRAVLDEWVTQMVLAGHEHGGCAFDGWTATIAAGARRGSQPAR